MGGGGTGEMETLRTLFPLCSEIDMQDERDTEDDGTVSLGASELLFHGIRDETEEHRSIQLDRVLWEDLGLQRR